MNEGHRFGRCDHCHSERLTYPYKGLWLCKTGPNRCWRRRRDIHAIRLMARKRSNEKR